jgi:RNA polymerase sigma-70 factor (ECF subfamily)
MAGSFLRRPSPQMGSTPSVTGEKVTGAVGGGASSEPEAFARLYERFFDPVYWYCRRRLQTPEAAEDAAALVFANALAAGPRWNDPSLRSWLFSIAHNVVANALRASAARATEPLDAAEAVADRAPLPEQSVLAAEERDEVQRALATLPDDQRHVVELRMAGLTGPEVANVLGRSHAAVKMLQLRAYARLRDLLRPGADHEGTVRHG